MPTEREINEYIGQMEDQLEAERNKTRQLTKGQMSLFEPMSDDNLIRWQLDLKEDLDRIYHLLRGDQIKEDSEGNVVYVEPENADLKPFNEFGVQMIMNIMSFYLNRNTILSNYDNDTINWKILDFGKCLSDLIFNRYEEMMTTVKTDDEEILRDHIQKKIKMYPMIVLELVDTVHSAYLRAYHGGERESLRTARTVTQSEPLGTQNQFQGFSSPKRFKLLSPSTWTNR